MGKESNRNSRILTFKNPITKVKNSKDGFNNKFNTGRDRINELKDRSEEITQNEAERDKMVENIKMRKIQ